MGFHESVRNKEHFLYGDSPLKIKILKSGFLHAREDQKIGPKPKFHAPTPLLKIKISKIVLRHVLSLPKVGLESKFHDPGTFGGFGKRKQTHRHDSCFISIDERVLCRW